MAVGGRQRTLLGFLDEYMDEDLADFTTSKIGGRPDLCCAGSLSPACDVCGSTQPLITQIYAPLTNSEYHRTLYLFCCVQPACWNTQKSWSCYRSQIKEVGKEEKGTSVTSAPFSTDWLEDAEDWGDEDNGNEKIKPASTPSSPDSPPPQGAVGGVRTARGLDNFQVKETTLEHLSLDESKKPGKVEDGNANERIHQIFNPTRGDEATAEIEMDDNDSSCVSVDIPQIDTSHIPGLFQTKNSASVPTLGVIIDPRYIWVGEEGEDSPTASQHEIQLIKQFQMDGSEDVGGGGGEIYEKILPAHGDEYSHNLISTIQRNPGQVLRYSRNNIESALVFQPLDLIYIKSLRCEYCGLGLVYELQLLPTLVSTLQSRSLDGTLVEFGTVLVFSCSGSCWKDGDSFRREIILLQQENM